MRPCCLECLKKNVWGRGVLKSPAHEGEVACRCLDREMLTILKVLTTQPHTRSILPPSATQHCLVGVWCCWLDHHLPVLTILILLTRRCTSCCTPPFQHLSRVVVRDHTASHTHFFPHKGATSPNHGCGGCEPPVSVAARPGCRPWWRWWCAHAYPHAAHGDAVWRHADLCGCPAHGGLPARPDGLRCCWTPPTPTTAC